MPSKRNLCLYWCFDYQSNPSKPWYNRHTCGETVCGIAGSIGLVVGGVAALFFLLAFFGIANDIVKGIDTCSPFGKPFDWEKCWDTASSSTGFYFLGLLWSGFLLGPWVALIFCAIQHIVSDTIRKIVRISFILFLIPIPAFISQGVSILWFMFGMVSKNECSWGDLNKFFSISCTYQGLILGCILIGFNVVVIGLIAAIVKCSICCKDLRKQREYDIKSKTQLLKEQTA